MIKTENMNEKKHVWHNNNIIPVRERLCPGGFQLSGFSHQRSGQ